FVADMTNDRLWMGFSTATSACAEQSIGIPMRKIIFLDFDRVLHPDGVGLFSKLPLLESFLSRMPEVEVVISSTWRDQWSHDR
ncbi:MAG TPA: hypothetical protein PLY64_11455, partial [Dokdonella sp.]|nr:hypothetical protein [Dokdonella sp.]